MLCVVNAHAGKLVLDGHDWMLQQHAFLCAVHDLAEFLCLAGAKAWNLTAVTDWLGDAVWTAVHFGHDRGKECSAFRAELIARSIMIAVTVDGKGFFDIGLFLRYIIFNFDWLFFR